MLTLNLATSLPIMRQALADKRLGFQTGKEACQYRYFDGSCCIIGALLPDEIVDCCEDMTVTELAYETEPIDVEDSSELDTFERLQFTHDILTGEVYRGETTIAEAEAKMTAALDQAEARLS